MTLPIRVLYNDTCPVCRTEVAAYQRATEACGLPVAYDPLDRAADWGLTPDQAARALHVRQGDRVLRGVPAFRALWAAMPGRVFPMLARITGWPVVAPVTAFLYDRIAAPVLYRRHLRRQR